MKRETLVPAFLAVLRLEPMALHMLIKRSITGPCPQFWSPCSYPLHDTASKPVPDSEKLLLINVDNGINRETELGETGYQREQKG